MNIASLFQNAIGLPALNSMLLGKISPDVIGLLNSSKALVDAQTQLVSQLSSLVQNINAGAAARPPFCRPAPIMPPSVWDSGQPTGSLRTNGNAIETAGGYKIEMLGQYEWKITGPDGKSTRVWGDPHVAEGDGGQWDFKRNSTFVLGDGTRINVTTKPWGNMTVTGQLEVISGNDRVVASDIDKGPGRIGTVTQDGYAHANSFQGDVFVQGRETDDWSLGGHEIVGSNNGGDSFKLGGELAPAMETVDRFGGALDWAQSVFDGLMSSWSDSFRPGDLGVNAYTGNTREPWQGMTNYDRKIHMRHMRNSFRALGKMFMSLSKVASLGQQISAGRFFGARLA